MTLKTTKFDAAEYLDSPEAIAAYLAESASSGDAAEFRSALSTVARAIGMTEIARRTNLGRESLYKALGADGSPEFGTIWKVLHASGVKMEFSPAEKPSNPVVLSQCKTIPAPEYMVVELNVETNDLLETIRKGLKGAKFTNHYVSADTFFTQDAASEFLNNDVVIFRNIPRAKSPPPKVALGSHRASATKKPR